LTAAKQLALLAEPEPEELGAVQSPHDGRIVIRRAKVLDGDDVLEISLERAGREVQRFRLRPAVALGLSVQLQIAAARLRRLGVR
jgi:hypothetical protein